MFELPVCVAINANNNLGYVVNKGSDSVTVLLDAGPVVTNLIVTTSSRKRSLSRNDLTICVKLRLYKKRLGTADKTVPTRYKYY